MPIITYVNDTLIILLTAIVTLLGTGGVALVVASVLSRVAPQGWAWRELRSHRKVFGAGITLLCLSAGVFSVVQWIVF